MSPRIVTVLVALVAQVALTGASCNKPYSLKITDVGESSPQTQAVIALSDAQDYARETLVNDRRDEIEYLRKLIDESRTIALEPQLRRDVRSVNAIAAEVSAAFDPAKSIEFGRAKELGDIQQEINKTRLQLELEQELAKLTALREEQKKSSVTPVETPPPGPNPQPTATTLPAATPGFTQTDQVINKVKALVTAHRQCLRRTSESNEPPSWVKRAQGGFVPPASDYRPLPRARDASTLVASGDARPLATVVVGGGICVSANLPSLPAGMGGRTCLQKETGSIDL